MKDKLIVIVAQLNKISVELQRLNEPLKDKAFTEANGSAEICDADNYLIDARSVLQELIDAM